MMATLIARRMRRPRSTVLYWAQAVFIPIAMAVFITVSESPQYTENIKGKIKSLRQMGHGPGTKRLEEMIEEITACGSHHRGA